MRGLRSTHWLLRDSPGDVKPGVGNIVGNTVIIPVVPGAWTYR